MLQHGGVATRLAFDKVEQFDLHTFLKTVVPGLNKQDRTLTVMRNSVAGEYMFLLGDQVIRYHTTDVAEVPLDRKGPLAAQAALNKKVNCWDT